MFDIFFRISMLEQRCTLLEERVNDKETLLRRQESLISIYSENLAHNKKRMAEKQQEEAKKVHKANQPVEEDQRTFQNYGFFPLSQQSSTTFSSNLPPSVTHFASTGENRSYNSPSIMASSFSDTTTTTSLNSIQKPYLSSTVNFGGVFGLSRATFPTDRSFLQSDKRQNVEESQNALLGEKNNTTDDNTALSGEMEENNSPQNISENSPNMSQNSPTTN